MNAASATKVEYSLSAFPVSLTALLGARKPEDPLPTRLRIFKMGVNETNQGPFIVNDQTIAQLAAVQRHLGREDVAVGFEHNIDPGSDEYKRTTEPRDVAAKAARVVGVPGAGIDLVDIAWTKLGADKIGNYEDLSPTPVFDKKTRRVIGIQSASLTRTGSMFGLTLDNAATATLSAVIQPQENPMNDTDFISVAQLAAVFHLPETATGAEVCAFIAKLSAPPVIVLEVQENGQPKKIELTTVELASRFIALETSIDADRARNGTAEIGNLIAQLGRDGKAPVDPTTNKPFSVAQLSAMTPDTLRLLTANTPSTVPLTQRARLSAIDQPAVDPTLTGLARTTAAFDRANKLAPAAAN